MVNGVKAAGAGRGGREGLPSLSSSSKLSSHSLFSVHRFEQCEQRRKEAKLTCRTICRDYCNNTAVHGFRYFFEESRSPVERVFWVCAVLVCFVVAFSLISKIWSKWETCPVIVTFADKPTPIWEVPFPAVTVCPSTKSKKRLFNYTRTYHKVASNTSTDEELLHFEAINVACVTGHIGGSVDSANESTVQFLRDVAPTLDEVFEECYWQLWRFNCSEYFREVLTEEGVCFTFNSLSSREIYTNITVQAQFDPPSKMSSGWVPETGYRNDDPTLEAFYPQRSTFTGPFTALRLILRSSVEDMDYLCHGCEQGFRVRLHNPAESSGSSGHVLAVPLNTSVMMLAKPSLIQTSAGLQELSPARRSCLFSHERPLKYFNMYSQDNCLHECYSNLTVRECGCAPLGMPRERGTSICISMSQCIMKEYYKVLNHTVAAMRRGGDFGPLPCNCLPSCTILRYDGEASVDTYPWERRDRALGLRPEATEQPGGVSKSHLEIYFNSLQFVSSRRSELYGHTDFLANFGGLLGLFTGFSVISLVEVAYYVSLRLWVDIRRRAADRRRRELRRIQ